MAQALQPDPDRDHRCRFRRLVCSRSPKLRAIPCLLACLRGWHGTEVVARQTCSALLEGRPCRRYCFGQCRHRCIYPDAAAHHLSDPVRLGADSSALDGITHRPVFQAAGRAGNVLVQHLPAAFTALPGADGYPAAIHEPVHSACEGHRYGDHADALLCLLPCCGEAILTGGTSARCAL